MKTRHRPRVFTGSVNSPRIELQTDRLKQKLKQMGIIIQIGGFRSAESLRGALALPLLLSQVLEQRRLGVLQLVQPLREVTVLRLQFFHAVQRLPSLGESTNITYNAFVIDVVLIHAGLARYVVGIRNVKFAIRSCAYKQIAAK